MRGSCRADTLARRFTGDAQTVRSVYTPSGCYDRTATTMPESPPSMSTKRRVKRFSPLQLGKMLAVLYGIMGLLFIPLFLSISTLAAQLPPEQHVGILAFGMGAC
jgi:hypothetical protein